MFITVIGKSYSTKQIAEKLAQNKNNLVFTTAKTQVANYIDIEPNNVAEIKEFIIANEISLLIAADKNYVDIDYANILCDTECCVISPDEIGFKICTSLSSGKKFAYKNKILTPVFAAFDKYSSFMEYIKTANFPIVISPEYINKTQGCFIAETKTHAERYAEILFQTGNKKIAVEEYIQGIEYTKYFLINNNGALSLFDTVNYFDEISTNNTDYIKKKTQEKINTDIIPLLLNDLMEEGGNYCGIIGVTFVIDKNENVYFSKFKPFLDDLDVDIALNTIEDDLGDIFYACASGKTLNATHIRLNNSYAISCDIKGEFISTKAKTMNSAIKIATYEGVDKKIIDEAIGNWKR